MKNLLFALCFAMIGCDSTSDGTDALGVDGAGPTVKDSKLASPETSVPATDAGVPSVFCQAPMPTGELAQKPAQFMLTKTDVVGECEILKAQPPTSVIWNGKAYVAFNMVDCHDAAHDFAGNTGLSWCLSATNCQVTSTGVQTCDIATFGIMGPPRPQREYAVCSPSGVFLGWSC